MTRLDSPRLNQDLDDGRGTDPRRRLALANPLRAGIFRPRDRAARIDPNTGASCEPAEVLPMRRGPGRSLLAIAALAFALVECAFWIAHADRPPRPPVCAAWDDLARHTLVPMMHASTVVASRQLNDALAQLRRARQNCRAGRLDLARRDYEALRNLNETSGPSLAQD
jgi:hypothetical protein